jgi:signal peptidase I
MKRSDALVASIPTDAGRAAISRQPLDRSQAAIASTYEHPEWWSETNLFSMRNERNYQLANDHYFPMGDNSAQSADARAWRDEHTGADHNYVEQRFMLGKALVVFWPHWWHRPIPFFPNFSRMGLIR